MRTKQDFYRDYHIENIPIYPLCPPARVPQRVEAKQHPENDPVFMALTIAMEECSNINKGCQGCIMVMACTKLQSALSEKGSDRLIKINEAHEFMNKFLRLIKGDK